MYVICMLTTRTARHSAVEVHPMPLLVSVSVAEILTNNSNGRQRSEGVSSKLIINLTFLAEPNRRSERNGAGRLVQGQIGDI